MKKEPLQNKKITLATVKGFVKKNRQNLFINVKSSFDGMVDCCMPQNGGFEKATEDKTQSTNKTWSERTLNIVGAWFVGSSRDYFNYYNNGEFEGIEVYNSCGKFILAVKITE